MLSVGAAMPAFRLTNESREKVTEADFAGSVAVIAFYPLAFTGG